MDTLFAMFLSTSVAATQFCRQSDISFQSHHRCVTTNESYVSHLTPSRDDCVLYCSHHQNCHVVNFNMMTGRCLTSEEPCLRLEPDEQYHTTYFKPNTCLKWVPLGQRRLDHMISVYPCNTPNVPLQLYCYIVRSISSPNTLPGLFYYDDLTYTVLDDNILRTGTWEGLEVSPGCPIQWVQYTAGNDLPQRSVVGGHLASDMGSDLYVVRVTTIRDGHDVIISGYYNPASQKAYAVFFTALTFTEMEILVLG